MSKDKKKPQAEVALTPEVVDMAPPPTPATPLTPSTAVVPGPVPAPNPRLMDIDKMALDLAKEQRKTALAEAKTALANNEKAELSFKYVVLQLYMKYGLTDQDAISEAGEIIKGGAARPQGQ